MRRVVFLMALPLIGLAGFGLSFWSPNAAHARPQTPRDPPRAEQSARAAAERDRALDASAVAKRDPQAR